MRANKIGDMSIMPTSKSNNKAGSCLLNISSIVNFRCCFNLKGVAVDEAITNIMNMIPEWKDKRFDAFREQLHDVAVEPGESRRSRGKAQKLGAQIVHLLHTYDVPTKPIYDRVDGGALQQNGSGWHVANIKNYSGENQTPDTVMFGLSEAGEILEFYNKSFRIDLDPSRKNVEIRGMIFTQNFNDEKAHSLMTNPTYLRGVASLIRNHRFYSDQNIYDYR
jgi:hypothetical protein